MKFTVRVPATSANLGPGFDSFGLALKLYNEVTIDTEAEPRVTWEGEGADELPPDGSDLISRAMAYRAGEMEFDLPPVAMHGVNRIPLERGLGSSAAAAVAGAALAGCLAAGAQDEDPSNWLAPAVSVEGHPDNVAAAVFGGFTVAYDMFDAVRLEPSIDLRPVALIPQDRLSTAAAREALLPQIERGRAVFNIQRAALGVIAFTQRPDLLTEALKDRVHQDERLALLPAVKSVFDELTSQGVPVCVSGAGPSLLAFEQEGKSVPDPGDGWRVLPLEPDLTGARIV